MLLGIALVIGLYLAAGCSVAAGYMELTPKLAALALHLMADALFVACLFAMEQRTDCGQLFAVCAGILLVIAIDTAKDLFLQLKADSLRQ